MKYYAVKTGRQPGIYATWTECREQVSGYPGAVFKSFEEEAAAISFLQASEQDQQEELPEDTPHAYIDGSCRREGGNTVIYGYGGYLFNHGRYYILQGSGNDPQFLPQANVSGEVFGALAAIHKAMQLGIKDLIIYHDYEGLAHWISGEWQCKTPIAKHYSFTAGLVDGMCINLHFRHIKGHSGDEGNDMADWLAKDAIGAKLPTKKAAASLAAFKEAAGHNL